MNPDLLIHSVNFALKVAEIRTGKQNRPLRVGEVLADAKLIRDYLQGKP